MNVERLRRMKLQAMARKARTARRAELAAKRVARRQTTKKRSRVVSGTSRKVRRVRKRLAEGRAAALKAVRAVRSFLVARKKLAAAWDDQVASLWKSVVSTQLALCRIVPDSLSERALLASLVAPTPSDEVVAVLDCAIEEVDGEIEQVKEWGA